MKQSRLFGNKIFQKVSLLLIIGSILLSACNQQPAETINNNQVALTFAAIESQRTEYEALITAFEAENPDINVQFVALEVDPGNMSGFASQADAIALPVAPVGADTYNYLDLDPVLAENQHFDESTFWLGSLNGCRAEGRLIGIPLSIQTLLVMYDGAAFAEMGLEHPAPGWRWEDFAEAAQALTKREGGKTTRYGFVDYGRPTALLAPLIDAVYRQYGNEFDPDVMASTLNWYITLAQEGVIPTNYEDKESGEPRDYISNGQAAMWVDTLSSLEQRRKELGDAIAVVPFPENNIGNGQQTTQAWATCGYVSAGTRYPQEAATWLQFLAGKMYPGLEPWAAPATKAATEASGFWNKLDGTTANTAHYAMEHGWYGAASNLPFGQIGDALNHAKSGSVQLVDVLRSVPISPDLARTVSPQITPIVVASPKQTHVSPIPSDNAIVIDYYVDTSYYTNMETVEAVAQAFMLENPEIVIQLEDYESSDLPYINFDLLTENYDCFIYQSGLGNYYNSKLFNLEPLINADGDGQDLLNDLPKFDLLQNQVNGDLFGLPITARPTILYFNKELFIKVGVKNPPINWGWNDFWQTAIAMTSDETYGFVPINGREFIDILLGTEGIELYNFFTDTPVINFNDPKVHVIVSNLVEMENNGVIPPIDEYIDWKKGNSQFRLITVENGKAAMWLNMAGLEYGGYFYNGAPNFEVGVAPVPSYGYPRIPVNNSTAFYISRQAIHPVACWQWIKFLSVKPEALAGIPMRQSVLSSKQYEQIVGENLADAYRAMMEHPQQVLVEDYQEKYPSYPLYLWWPSTLASVFEGVPVSRALTELQGKSEQYLSCIKASSNPHNEDVWKGCAIQADPEFESLLYSD